MAGLRPSSGRLLAPLPIDWSAPRHRRQANVVQSPSSSEGRALWGKRGANRWHLSGLAIDTTRRFLLPCSWCAQSRHADRSARCRSGNNRSATTAPGQEAVVHKFLNWKMASPAGLGAVLRMPGRAMPAPGPRTWRPCQGKDLLILTAVEISVSTVPANRNPAAS